MSDLRHDPIQRRWVIIATERGQRPSEFKTPPEEKKGGFCPFCPGNEHTTPPEILAHRHGTAANATGWDIRVVPNKFPALRIEGDPDRTGVGLYDRMNGIGAHEVVIESPSHTDCFPDFTVEHIDRILSVYQARLRDLQGDQRFRYLLVFKNHGAIAGASLAHPHTQIIATPITPRTVSIELQSMKDHFMVKERCLVCDIIHQELDMGVRLVSATEDFVVVAPYASRFPFELFIAPRRHAHSFLACDGGMRRNLAAVMKDTFTRLKASLNDPPFNFVFHIAPSVSLQPHRAGYWQTLQFDFHWHIEIIPRLTRMAGFEWGTGFYINPTPPEEAAKYLREVEV
jgi:UDPglucose--hexose-1-phosphate uridylyltransferase